jgi:hypothetical protein
VTKGSDALDLQRNVFTWKDPKRICRFVEAFGAGQQAPQGRPVPFRLVDVDPSCRQEPPGRAPTNAIGRQEIRPPSGAASALRVLRAEMTALAQYHQEFVWR